MTAAKSLQRSANSIVHTYLSVRFSPKRMTALGLGFNQSMQHTKHCVGTRPERCRSRLALTLAEREEISRAVAAGQSIRSTAILLKRAPSTISREIRRNGGTGRYRAVQADQAAWDLALRPKTSKTVTHEKPQTRQLVADSCAIHQLLHHLEIIDRVNVGYAADIIHHYFHSGIRLNNRGCPMISP